MNGLMTHAMFHTGSDSMDTLTDYLAWLLILVAAGIPVAPWLANVGRRAMEIVDDGIGNLSDSDY